jgi:hypothetical protein
MLPRGIRQVYHIRKAADPSDNFTSIWKKVFRDLQISAEVDGKPIKMHISDIYSGRDITPDDVVRELSSFNQNDIPIIVIDEFNEITDKAVPRLMANTIKALSDDGVNATLITVGVADSVADLHRRTRKHQSLLRRSLDASNEAGRIEGSY